MAEKAQAMAVSSEEGVTLPCRPCLAPWKWHSQEQEAAAGELCVRGFICEGQFSQHPTKLVLLSHFTEKKTEPWGDYKICHLALGDQTRI